MMLIISSIHAEAQPLSDLLARGVLLETSAYKRDRCARDYVRPHSQRTDDVCMIQRQRESKPA